MVHCFKRHLFPRWNKDAVGGSGEYMQESSNNNFYRLKFTLAYATSVRAYT